MADRFPLSPQQEWLWLQEPYGPSARMQLEVAIAGPLDEGALQDALRATVARHEILRTTFERQPGLRVPLQVIREQLEPQWHTLDLRALAPGAQPPALAEAAARELAEPVDLAEGSSVRALLVARGAAQHTLVLTLTALHADQAAISPLLAELSHHLIGAGELVEEPVQYADYSEWLREEAASEEPLAVEARAHWSSFWGADSPSLPFTREATGTFTPTELDVALDPELQVAIETQADAQGVSVQTFVEAAWQALLGRMTGEDSVVVGLIEPETHRPELAGAIGPFTRSLPVRTEVAGDVAFADVAAQVDRAREDHAKWGDYAPAELCGNLRVGFVAVDPFEAEGAELTLSLERVANSGGHFRLWLTCERPPAGLRLVLRFDSRQFQSEQVQQLASQLGYLLRALAAGEGSPLGEVDVLDPETRRRVLVDFNETERPVASSSVLELIGARAAAAPGRIAVVDEQKSISYGQLEARANQLAHRLRRSGVGPDVTVGLCADRTVDLVVGLLGILKAGGAYLPLHHEHPPVRLAQQLDIAGARIVVTQRPLLERLVEFGGEVICLDRDRAELDAEPADAPEIEVSPDDLVYLIFTSGSTGVPKGVAVTHGNLVNYATDIVTQLGADAEPLAFGLITSISTDLGNTSVFGALCSGGTLVLIGAASAADGALLARQLEATPVDVLKITPSHIGALLAGGDGGVLPRRWLVLGGERAPWDLIGRIRDRSTVAILNHYGPTETTVGCTTFIVGEAGGSHDSASVPIGRPIANTACYILDEYGKPVPIGVPGMLFIGGAGVARGYVGQPELTGERFPLDPFAGERSAADLPTARMYDTGDRARWLPDGTIEFLGRKDEQVKVRGYRVEPGEIESALRSHPQVREAVVTAAAGAGEVRLIAYYAGEDGLASEELRGHLADRLPEFMIPSVLAGLDELPRSASGKVDRLALPDPDTLLQSSGPAYVAPRTAVEEAVAAIWAQMLGVERVGVEDDFFELGGHSLLATHTIAQLRNEFAIDLQFHALFLSPTVESLAVEIAALLELEEPASGT